MIFVKIKQPFTILNHFLIYLYIEKCYF